MRVGTRSVLYGAHCFFLHPWFVAAAWWKLYGFPWDPRLWVAFVIHDLGYLGKPNMDGPEGERHPEFGASVMSIFDIMETNVDRKWERLALLHSRYYAKKLGLPFSRLCVADKLSIALTPWWLYLPMVTATGEVREYLKNAQTAESSHWKPTGFDKRTWYRALQKYMREWVEAHRNGAVDTWTRTDRHASKEGVWS